MEEGDVGIICVIMYDDLALEAWTQSTERERVCVCVCERDTLRQKART